MKNFIRSISSVGLFLFVTFAGAQASADVQECLTASEKGQQARAAGKLREARQHFVLCGAETCPSLVRHDCAQWNAELAQSLPSIVFGARDAEGRDLFDVVVTMDGEKLLDKLDGKAVAVDPGKHSFRFEAEGLPPVTEDVLVKEGERARVVNITFESDGHEGPVDNSSSVSVPSADGGSGKPVYPWIAVGLGAAAAVAGTVVALTAPERPSNCNADTLRCTRREGQSDADFRQDQERAGRADSQPVLGIAVAAGGGALLLGGLIWYLLSPSPSSTGDKAGWTVAPWMSARSSGVALGATW